MLRKLWQLFSNPSAYHLFLTMDAWQVLKHYLVGIFFISVVWSAWLYFRMVPQAEYYTAQALSELSENYPLDTTVTWNGKRLNITPTAEYSLAFPDFIASQNLALPTHFALFHPEELSLEEVQENVTKTSLLVVTPTTMYVRDQKEILSTAPLSELFLYQPPFTLDNTNKASMLASWQIFLFAFYNWLAMLVVLLSPIIVLISTTWNGLFQLFLTYLIVVILYRRPFTAGQMTKLAVPISLAAAMINTIGLLLYRSLSFPLFSIAYWVILFFVLRSIVIVRIPHRKINTSK